MPGESLRSVADTNCDRNGNSRSKRYAYRDGYDDCYSNSNTYPYAKAYANATTCADAKGATNAAAATVVGNITN